MSCTSKSSLRRAISRNRETGSRKRIDWWLCRCELARSVGNERPVHPSLHCHLSLPPLIHLALLLHLHLLFLSSPLLFNHLLLVFHLQLCCKQFRVLVAHRRAMRILAFALVVAVPQLLLTLICARSSSKRLALCFAVLTVGKAAVVAEPKEHKALVAVWIGCCTRRRRRRDADGTCEG